MPKRHMHREVFFAHNGAGPYECFGCHGPVEFHAEFDIHHLDENDSNNEASNLRAMHQGCHMRLHKTGRIVSAETRAKIGAKHKGRVNSAAHRLGISKAMKARVWTPEMRAKISRAHKGRVKSAAQCQKIAQTLRARVKTQEEIDRHRAVRQALVTESERQRLSVIGKLGAAARWRKET